MHAEQKGNTIIIYDSFVHKETIKQIPERIWDAVDKTWSIPYNEDNLITLKMIGCNLCNELSNKAKAVNLKRKNRDKSTNPVEPMPIKAVPYTHQIEAYNLACKSLEIFKVGDAY